MFLAGCDTLKPRRHFYYKMRSVGAVGRLQGLKRRRKALCFGKHLFVGEPPDMLLEIAGFQPFTLPALVAQQIPQRVPDGKKPSIRAQLKADRVQSGKPQQREKEQETKRSIRQALEME